MQITRISAYRPGPSLSLISEQGIGAFQAAVAAMPKPTPLAKSIKTDGRRIVSASFPNVKEFFFEVKDWQAADVARHLRRERPDEAFSLTARRDGLSCIGEKRGEDFVRAPQDMLILDVDGQPFRNGWDRERLIADPEACVRAHVAALLGQDAVEKMDWVVVLSSSCGFEDRGKPILRYHLYFDLDRHYPPHVIDRAIEEYKAAAPFIDGAIYRPGQFLLTARPILDVEDPFSVRVFSNSGGHALVLDARDHTDTVPLTLPPTRGRSSTLYRINRDRIAAREFVSDEVVTWTTILKANRPTIPWEEARPMLEAALIEAGEQSGGYAFRRMSRNGEYLGEARRIFEQNRGGSKRQVYGQRAYQEPEGSLETASESLRRIVEGQVGREGMFLNKVTLGVGKTHEIVALAARRPDLRFLILAPNHERCDEICDRLETARRDAIERLMPPDIWDEEPWEVEALDRRSWRVWRGRSAESMCGRLPVVEAAFKARVSVHRDVCGFEQELRCPLFDRCAYASQVESFWRHNWVVPVAMITHRSRIAAEADVVIVDEGCVKQLVGSHTFPLELLLEPRGARLDELSRRLHSDLLDGKRSLTVEEVTEALALERELMPEIVVAPNMDDDEMLRRCDLGTYRKERVSLWRALLSEFEGGENHIHVFTVHEDIDGQPVARWMAQVSWTVKPRLLEKAKSVLFFDATPNELAMKAHFPNIEIEEFQAPAQNTHVVQVVNNKGVRGRLLNPLDEPERETKEWEAWNAKEAEYRKKREAVAAWLRAQPGYTVVVTKKDYREAMEREQKFARVAFAHYGAVEGKDTWTFPDGSVLKGAEIDNLVLIGRSAPPPWVVEAEARKHHASEARIRTIPKPERGMPWYDEVPVELRDGVAGLMPVHPDERADATFKAIWRDTLMQAFGRGRSVRRERRLRVSIMHNMPLPVTVNEAVSDAELMARVGDVTLLSPKEIERVFGRSGRGAERLRVEANVRYWTREGQTQPYRGRVADGADWEAALRSIGAERWEQIE